MIRFISTFFSIPVLVVWLASITTTALAAECPDTAKSAQKALGVDSDDILMCTSEQWPGLRSSEFYVTIVSHDPESDDPTSSKTQSLVINVSTQKTYPAPTPNRFYFYAKDHAYDKILDELLRLAVAERTPNQKFQLQISCGDDRPTPRLSLAEAGGGYEWQIDFAQSGRCNLIRRGENPLFVASTVTIHPSRLRLSEIAATPEVKNLNLDFQIRQSFSDSRGSRDFLRDFVQSANDLCEFSKTPNLQARKATIFEDNQWTAKNPDSDKTAALELHLPGTAADRLRSASLDLYLQEKDALDHARIVGAWHVSSVFEAKNLIYQERDKSPKRIILRDGRCGKEYASNWIE